MILSVTLSDWNDLTAAVAVEPVALRPADESAFQKALKQAVEAEEPVTEQTVAAVKETDAVVAAKNTALHAPLNIIPQLPDNGVIELPPSLAAVDDLTPFLVAPTDVPGERLNTALAQTETTETKSLYRTDALKKAKNVSPYNISDKARAERDATALAQKALKKAPDADAAMPISKVKRFYGQPRAVGITNSVAKAQEAVTKQTAKANALEHEETYRQAVRQKRIDSGDLVNITHEKGGKIGYDRSTAPSMLNKNNSAAASWFPEAMTRTLDQYEALAKARSQGMRVDSEI